jgi:hypothetical protein
MPYENQSLINIWFQNKSTSTHDATKNPIVNHLATILQILNKM